MCKLPCMKLYFENVFTNANTSLNTFSASNGNTSLNSLTGSYATTGSNTFTARYKSANVGITATFVNRQIIVVPV